MNPLPEPKSQPDRLLLIGSGLVAVVTIIAVTAVMGLALVRPFDTAPPSPTPTPCTIETVNKRDVYDEPNNELMRVGAIEADTYRIVAFGATEWAAVDWQRSGITVTEDNLQFLDWIRLNDGVDLLIGDCHTVPRLAVRPSA